MTAGVRALVRDALDRLGIRRLVLGVHDAAFPMRADEDPGYGSPSSEGAAEVFRFAAALGFDAIQLGPAGATSAGNASPYDATLFSRDPLSVALAPLTGPEWGGILSREVLERVVRERPGGDRVTHRYAYGAVRRALATAASSFRARRAAGDRELVPLGEQLDAFRRANDGWLTRDALYEILKARHGDRAWTEWGSARDRELLAPSPGAEAEADARRRALLAEHEHAVEDDALVQLVAHAQHAAMRARAHALGLVVFGDLQVGMSERDAWAAQAFLLRDWRMGAPPSRTDPGGQAWGFPVLDPRRYRDAGPLGATGDGPALRFFRARVRKLASELDGLRVDHPHGLVCPWVYRVGPDPDAAVRSGARLFESPAVPEHPDLAPFAIARPDQIDLAVPRHADRRVRALDEAQVERYAVLLDAVMDAVGDPDAVACEILSTEPYPLARVVERYGLGRFRITQKADLRSPSDVYRGENAFPQDWIMLGNHDTPTIWRAAERWVGEGTAGLHARYLATRLLGAAEDRDAWVRATAADPGALAQAHFAELFAGPAQNVFVYFTDLVGAREPYNRPGTVSDANWSTRLAPGFAEAHARAAARGRALDVPRAVARALRGRGPELVRSSAELIRRLDSAP